MQEVIIKNNPLGLKILVNGNPDLRQLSSTEMKVFVRQSEMLIYEMYEKNEKRKKYKK